MQNIKQIIIKFLRYIEKWTQIDMVYIAKGGFYLTIGQSISVLSSFLLTAFLANYLPKETFGEYRFALAALPVLYVFTLPSLGIAITRGIAKKEKIDIHALAKEKIKFGTISSLVSFAISAYYLFKGNTDLSYLFLIIGIFAPFSEAFVIYLDYLNGKKAFKLSAKYEAITRVAQALSVASVAYASKSAVLSVAALLLSQAVMRFLFFRKNIQKKTNTDEQTKKHTKETLKYGKQLSAISFIGLINANLDKLLVWKFFGSSALASYAVAISIPYAMMMPFSLLVHTLLPKLSEKETKIRATSLIKIGLFAFIIPVIFVPLSYIIFPAIFPTYKEHLVFAQLISFLPPVMVIYSYLRGELFAKKDTYNILFITLFGLIVFISSFFIIYKLLYKNIYSIVISLFIYHILSIIFMFYFINHSKKYS